ncbi:MAG: hypothetical protein HFI33_04890 [Lachnospiraceae bacterium]|nr:hypothetical protein [Lachnospiraceae bacterium]
MAKYFQQRKTLTGEKNISSNVRSVGKLGNPVEERSRQNESSEAEGAFLLDRNFGREAAGI